MLKYTKMNPKKTDINELILLAKLGGEINLDGLENHQIIDLFEGLKAQGLLDYLCPIDRGVIHFICFTDSLTFCQDDVTSRILKQQQSTIILTGSLDGNAP